MIIASLTVQKQRVSLPFLGSILSDVRRLLL